MSDRPRRLEFTIGVCVPMIWNDNANQYQPVLDQIEITEGGLFDDATRGGWDPDHSDWSRNDSEDGSFDAALLAESIVAERIASPPRIVGGTSIYDPGSGNEFDEVTG